MQKWIDGEIKRKREREAEERRIKSLREVMSVLSTGEHATDKRRRDKGREGMVVVVVVIKPNYDYETRRQ